MPELPEVETICKQLQAKLHYPKIVEVLIRKETLRWPIPLELSFKLVGATINRVIRRAKYLLLGINKDQHTSTLIIHLGMSGRLSVVDLIMPVQKHDHVDLILNNNSILRYTDPRRFGAILWTDQDPLQHKLLINLGLEPFDQLFTAKYLYKKAQAKNYSIKQLIMDHKIVVGIGNIYANEALFAAKIHPQTLAKDLDHAKFKNLIVIIRKILTKAISTGGTTLKDYFDPNGIAGKFVNHLQIYGKLNKPCMLCGSKIQQISVAQRSTFYCPKCQILSYD